MNAALPLPRGVRNNNPGNIRHSRYFTWLHEIQPDDEGFCRFSDVTFGLRAMILLFHHYQEYAQLNTVSGLIARWAPATENNTDKYAAFVAAACMVLPSDPFTFIDHAESFCRAVVRYENGQDPYDALHYRTALSTALTQR